MNGSNDLLYLFSSNIRPLYEQDILDLIAAPENYVYQFRYEGRWLNGPAHEQWLDLAGIPVLVHFSLQQPARYHDPAVIPVRLGSVVETYVVGDVHIVRFNLSGYCTLAEPQKINGRKDYATPVRRYWEGLKKNGIDRPYDHLAVLDKDVRVETGLDAASDRVKTAALFQRMTGYLSGTQSFSNARFARFSELRELGGSVVILDSSKRVFELQPGQTYEIDFFHSQPGEITGRDSFTVTADETVVGFIGRPGFDVASRYDITTVSFHARVESDTLLVISPDEGVRGPTIRLPLRIRIPPGRKGIAAGGVILGSMLLAIAAISPDAWNWAPPVFLLSGTLINGLIAVFGFRGAK